MKNFSTGSGSTLKSPFSSTGTTGPTVPSSKTIELNKKNIDPASSYTPHKCPVPFFESRGRQ
jgi:hypothetical protein